jgi:hypothetical protein
MTAPEAPGPAGPSRSSRSSSEPLTRLRGASVNYDARKVARVAIGLCLVTVAVIAVVLTVAGIHNNSQINKLRHDGIPVTVTVTKCLGLMGGSGSNPAGYSCSGSFTIHGIRYVEALPGTAHHEVGSEVAATAVPNDPALVSPDSVLRSEHSSLSVFILPLVLLVVLALLIALIVVVRQRRRDPTGKTATEETP